MKRLLAVLTLISLSAKADVQLADFFDGTSIDTSKWNVLLPFSDSAVSIQNGSLKSVNRGKIVSNQEFNSPYTVSGIFRAYSSYDLTTIVVRSDEQTLSGIYLQFGDWNSNGLSLTVDIKEEPYAPPRADFGPGETEVNILPNTDYLFSITDYGNAISVQLNGNEFFNFSYNLSFPGSRIAFFSQVSNSENIGNSELKELQVTIPEPSSFSLILAGGGVLMAGRRRKS